MIVKGDCRVVMPMFGPFDMIVADPPYGETSLPWDRLVDGWADVALSCLKPTGSMWVFGSMRSFLLWGVPKGWRYAQDIVWEKHNGSGFAADRFKRVHEHVVQFYRVDAPWSGVFNDVQRVVYDGPNKSVTAPPNRSRHQGAIGVKPYVDNGTRIVRSVVKIPQPRDGKHGTQKPVDLLELLIRTSCPADGIVGDFFAGSGSAMVAAQRCGRQYVGAELNPVAVAA